MKTLIDRLTIKLQESERMYLEDQQRWTAEHAELQARIEELEKSRINRITCGFTDCQWQRQGKRLDAALADALKILRTHSSYKDDVDRIEKARAGE